MALTPRQIDELLRMIRQTKEVEMTCPECLDELDMYTQQVLDCQPLKGILEKVREHLEACPGCAKEYAAVRDALLAIEDDASPQDESPA